MMARASTMLVGAQSIMYRWIKKQRQPISSTPKTLGQYSCQLGITSSWFYNLSK